ncbi:MAG: oligosaccharide repeat unit polymerase [Desulfobacteraceae bacterium]|nr:MAG: oligosaccharide repeat unit polymerase [Desulfobacteraceae bacterium]
MSTIFLILLHITVLFLVLACWRADSGNRLVFTPFLVYMLVELSFSWSTWLLFLDTDVPVSDYAIAVSLLATLCFCLGFLISSKYIADISGFSIPGNHLHRYRQLEFQRKEYGMRYSAVFFLLAAIGIGCGTYYYRGYPPTVQGIARLAVEHEMDEDVQKELHDVVVLGRRELTKSHFFGGEYRGQGVVRGFMVAAWGYGLVLSLILAAADRKRRWWAIAFLFFVGSFYYVAGTGERSRFIWVLIMGLIGLSFVTRITARKMAVAGIVALSFLVLMTIFLRRYEPVQGEGNLVWNVLAGVGNRIASGNKINNVRIINFLEDQTLEFTYGRTHLNEMMNVLPGIQELPLSHRLGEIIKPGKTTYYSGTYLGTVYVDFGLPGVIVIYLLLGIFMRAAFQVFLSMPKNVENMAFMSFAVYSLGKMGIDGGVTAFVSAMVPAVGIFAAVKTTLLATCQPSISNVQCPSEAQRCRNPMAS